MLFFGPYRRAQLHCTHSKVSPLKTLASLNEEVRPFSFLRQKHVESSLGFFPQRLQHLEVLKAVLALRS